MNQVQKHHWYILDANGKIFGNPKGYKRHQDAERICTRKRYELWSIYDNRTRTESNLIYEIKLEGSLN